MERTLAWTILAIGVLGFLGAVGLTTRDTNRAGKEELRATTWPVDRQFLAAALALPVLVWLATMPSMPPFAPGGGWGQGFACGAILALLSITATLRNWGEDAGSTQSTLTSTAQLSRDRIAATAPLFGALIAATLPFLFLRSSLLDALNGMAMGWTTIGCLLWLGLRGVATRGAPFVVLASVGFAVVLCLATMLGVYRDAAAAGTVAVITRDAHAISALALAAGIPLALFCSALVASLLSSRAQSTLSAPHVLTALVSVAMLLCLGYLLNTRLLSSMRGFYAAEIGLLAGLLVAWTARAMSGRVELIPTDSNRKADEAAQSTLEAMPEVAPSPLPLLVLFSAFVVSYQMWQGFGTALMLLAAWPVAFSAALSVDETRGDRDVDAVAFARRDATRQAIIAALFFSAVLLASRVFDTRFRDVLRVAFASDQHALFGLLIGALLPPCGAKLFFLDADSSRSASTIWRAMMVGAAVALVLGWLVMLWGVRPLPAVFAGLALGAGSSAIFGTRGRFAIRETASSTFVALGAALLLVQWTGRVLPLAQASRGQRLEWLSWGVALAAMAVLISAAATRARHWQMRKSDLETLLAGEKP